MPAQTESDWASNALEAQQWSLSCARPHRGSTAFLKQPDATLGPWGLSSTNWSSHCSGLTDWTSWLDGQLESAALKGSSRQWGIGLTTGWLCRVEKKKALILTVGWFLEDKYPWVHAKLLQSCPTLCNPMDYSPPGSSVHGILQARILEWVPKPSSRGSSQPRDQTRVSCTGRRVFATSTTWEAQIFLL